MNKRYGVIYEYEDPIDLDPFPTIPAGALWTGDMFLVAGSLHTLYTHEVNELMVITDSGSIYLSEAIGHYEKYNSMAVMNYSDMEDLGPVSVIGKMLEGSVNDTSHPIVLLPGNILTDLSIASVEGEHLAHKRPLMTMVVVPGVNRTELELPPGYRPTNIVIIEKKIAVVANRVEGKTKRLVDLAIAAQNRKQFQPYIFDGFIFEVTNEEDYATLKPGINEE